jgi:hypothetical protein
MRLARRTRAEAWPDEVVYYDYPDAPSSGSRDESGRRVPRPYAYWGDIAACDSGGRWVGSTVDYLRFLLALTGRRGPALLRPDTLRVIDDRMSMLPRGASLAGLGWALYTDGADLGWSHGGSLPGSMSYVVHSFHGVDWVAVFNSRPKLDAAYDDLVRVIAFALRRVERWPDHDLFADFPP